MKSSSFFIKFYRTLLFHGALLYNREPSFLLYKKSYLCAPYGTKDNFRGTTQIDCLQSSSNHLHAVRRAVLPALMRFLPQAPKCSSSRSHCRIPIISGSLKMNFLKYCLHHSLLKIFNMKFIILQSSEKSRGFTEKMHIGKIFSQKSKKRHKPGLKLL